MRQHLHSWTKPKCQSKVEMHRLADDQGLAMQSPCNEQTDHQLPRLENTELFECTKCKLHFNDLHCRNFHNMVVHVPKTLNLQPFQPVLFAFSCDAPGCDFSSRFFKSLKMHKKRKHNNAVNNCHLCGNVYNLNFILLKHMRQHKTQIDGIFKCLYPGCNQTLPESEFKQHFDQHKQLLQGAPSYECRHCNTFHHSEAVLKNHISKHFVVMPSQLNGVNDSCKDVYTNSADLKKHIAEHKKKVHNFSCLKCSKCFSTNLKLQQHMKMHLIDQNSQVVSSDVAAPAATLSSKTPKQSGVSAFVCEYCNCTFMTLSHLNLHFKQHKTDMPGIWKCNRRECKKRFGSVVELQEHSKTHKLETFTCEICGKFFGSSFRLVGHMKRHLGERAFRCDAPGCSYAGKVREDLRIHKQNVHENNASCHCHMCGKFLKQWRSLKKHTALHETGTPGVFKCSHPECRSTRFSSTDELKKHYMFRHKENSQQPDCSVANCELVIESSPHTELEDVIKIEELIID